MNNEIRLLTKEEYEALPDDYKNAIISQFGILLGGRFLSDKTAEVEYDNSIHNGFLGTYYINDLENAARKRTSYHSYTQLGSNPYFKSDIGLRFVMDIPEGVQTIVDNKGNEICYYGTYPNKVTNKEYEMIINSEGTKKEEGISIYLNGQKVELPVIEVNGKYYAQMTNYKLYNSKVELPDGREIEQDASETLYLEIAPLLWIKISDSKMVSADVVVSGVPFAFDRNTEITSFDETVISDFIKNDFSKDILKFKEEQVIKENSNEEVEYDFDTVPTILERMDLSLSLNDVIFLHGLPASGKSDRVYELDPNATVVYLASQDPSLIFGAEMIDMNSVDESNTVRNKLVLSYWVKEILKKATEDPDNIHILFFDEFTNAHPQIQQVLLRLIDDRTIGNIKLPDNVRIILAGNEISDSFIAHTVVEPLKSRVAHIQVDTNLSDWLEWAYENNIHPYITSFIKLNEDCLRTKYNGIRPHCDPRRWAMASKVLYKTNNPNLLEGLIEEGVLNKFVEYCKLSDNVKVEDFLKYTKNDFIDIQDPSSISESKKYSVMASLANKINNSDELI